MAIETELQEGLFILATAPWGVGVSGPQALTDFLFTLPQIENGQNKNA